MSADRYDVVIAGARVAGAATALLLARAGLRVLVIDRGQYGTDTLSTHALMRGGVLQLLRWGALPRIVAEATPPVTGSRFLYGNKAIDIAVKPRDGVNALYAPRRTVLDRILVDMAREAGATVEYGTTVRDVEQRQSTMAVTVAGRSQPGLRRTITCDIVIGADGIQSRVAECMGARAYRSGEAAMATVYAHWPDLGFRVYQWSYAPGAAAGVIPTNSGTCVFASVAAHRFTQTFQSKIADGYRRTIAAADPDLAARLATMADTPALRGFAGRPGFFRQSWGPGWALVGDAGHFKDPTTAHGLTDAMRDAELLSRAVLCGTRQALAHYQDERDTLAMPIFEATEAIASFEWDLESLQQWHRKLSEAMAHEVRIMAAWPSAMPEQVAFGSLY